MTCLFQSHSTQRSAGEVIDNKLPFPMQSIRSLVEILLSSVSEISASQNSTAFPLIRAIVEAKVLIPEIYDLLEKLLEQTVLSHRKTVRESASSTITNYVLTYPLGDKRLASHIKQFVKNCSYEYEEGRLSALNLLETIVKLLPSTVLSDHAQTVFMAMSLRVVNDPAQICREKAAEIITALARRIDGELFKILLDYSITWLSVVSNESMSILSVEVSARVRTGSQIASILVSARPELAKKFSIVSSSVQTVREHLVAIISSTSEALKDDDIVVESEFVGASNPSTSHNGSEAGGTETWAVVYHLILFLEKLLISLTNSAEKAILKTSSSKGPELMCVIQEALLYPHSWVRIAACR
jgi:U3 small nucleolar RNA-associated protein 20